MDLKSLVAENLPNELKQYSGMLSKCVDSKNGDFTIPCFLLARELKKSPNQIAEELAAKISNIEFFEKAEAVNGYLNLFVSRQIVAKQLIEEFNKLGTSMFRDNSGDGKTVCVDYSSANLAKYLHIGHLSTTILGECIARIFETAGYKVVRVNFVGDYGTPFGKIVAGYQLWGKKEDIEARGVDAIQDLYVEFCKHEGEEYYDNLARETFRKIEEKDPETMKIYNMVIDISLEYNKKATKALGVVFDDCNGERYYNDKMDWVVEKLESLGLLKDGEGGSKIVDLGEKLGIVLIKKSDGTSLYSTRDIAAAIDRKNKYDFYKNYYVTDVAQRLHFEQVFKILELMGYPYAKDCEHIYYGRIRLPEGKISSRLGKQALIEDIVNEATNKAKDVIKDRNLPDADNVAKVVALGATAFIVTKNEKIKDTVFDINDALRFDGETSPYMQYTYARLSSILRKSEAKGTFNENYLKSDDAFEVVKLLCDFKNIIIQAIQKIEPNVVNKFAMTLCKAINKFYTTERVLTENADETFTKCELIKIAKDVIKFALNLICIDTVEVM